MLFAPEEKGQGLVEYALILVLVAIVVIVILALLGPVIGKVFSNVVRAVQSSDAKLKWGVVTQTHAPKYFGSNNYPDTFFNCKFIKLFLVHCITMSIVWI